MDGGELLGLLDARRVARADDGLDHGRHGRARRRVVHAAAGGRGRRIRVGDDGDAASGRAGRVRRGSRREGGREEGGEVGAPEEVVAVDGDAAAVVLSVDAEGLGVVGEDALGVLDEPARRERERGRRGQGRCEGAALAGGWEVGGRRTCCWAGRDRRAGRRPGGRRPGRGRVLVRRGEGRPGREGHDHRRRRRRCREGVLGRGSDHRRSLAGLASGGCGCGTREVEGEGETTRMEKGRDGAWACAGGLLGRCRWRAGAAVRGLQSVQGSPGPCEERGGDSEPLTESLPRLASSLLSPTPSSLPAPLRAMNAPNGAIPLPTGLPSPSPDDLELDPEVEELWSSRALLLVRPHALAPSSPPPLWPECLSFISCHLPPPRHRRARDPQGAAAASPHLVGRGPSSTAISPHRHPLRAGRAREERLTDQLDPRARSTSPPRPSSSPSSPRTSRSPTSRNPAAAPRTDRDRDSTLKRHFRRISNHRWVRGPRSTRADSSHFVPPTSLLSPSQVLLLLILSFWVSYYLKVRRIRSIHETIIAMFSGASFLLLPGPHPRRLALGHRAPPSARS